MAHKIFYEMVGQRGAKRRSECIYYILGTVVKYVLPYI